MVTTDTNHQQTLAGTAVVHGVGLFTGREVRLEMKPGAVDTGVVFRRMDLEGAPEIPAHVDHVVQRPRRTTLEFEGVTVEMVEHCLSALAGLGIDNAVLEVSVPELPAGDGSALPYVRAVESVGVEAQAAPRAPIVVETPVIVRDGDATVAALPIDTVGCELMYVLDYGDASPIPRQVFSAEISARAYTDEIAAARTFSTEHEARAARSAGLFGHLTPRDMLVIGESGPIENSYRFPDEPVRHKLLDLLGDLYLAGRPIQARIVAHRSGHDLNHRLARELAELDRQRDRRGDERVAPAMQVSAIMKLLPHRYPMILIDRVLEIHGDERAVGVKNVTINEPFFQGHYPGTPLMPGVLIVEAMCQLAGLMLSHKLERTGKIAVLLSMDKVKLRKAVTPGDQLVMETEALRTSSRYGDVDCRAFVDGALVAEARVKFLMIDAEQQRGGASA